MEILPDTDIRILKNVPLDNTYEHTINFDTIQAQTNYFVGLTKHNLQRNTYQRYDKGIMRVEVRAEELYDCNYIMFRNTAFGSKWFYAFITSVEYVNNSTSKITYEIDVMQTWWFDFKVQQCFVEREHSATDVIGDNLVPENLDYGEYVVRKEEKVDLGDNVIIVASTVDQALKPRSGSIYNKIYQGCGFTLFETTNVNGLKAWIDELTEKNKEDSIVGMFMVPRFIAQTLAPNTLPNFKQIQRTKPYSDISGYKPRNRKLFTHPYNVLRVTNYSGNAGVYKYEDWYSSVTTLYRLMVYGIISVDSSMVILPQGYKGLEENYDEKITLADFPMCSYNIDLFKAYMAQVKTSIIPNAIADFTTTTIGGAISGGVAGKLSSKENMTAGVGAKRGALSGLGTASSNLLGTIGSTVATGYTMSTEPPQSKGTQSSNANFSLDYATFGIQELQIKKEFAMIIDDFFDKFGYATHRVKYPNHKVRPHWTYTKTVGATITGSVPADDMNKICSIYDNGITFWVNGSEVGNYSLYNGV